MILPELATAYLTARREVIEQRGTEAALETLLGRRPPTMRDVITATLKSI